MAVEGSSWDMIASRAWRVALRGAQVAMVGGGRWASCRGKSSEPGREPSRLSCEEQVEEKGAALESPVGVRDIGAEC